jgi:hypothetical protein
VLCFRGPTRKTPTPIASLEQDTGALSTSVYDLLSHGKREISILGPLSRGICLALAGEVLEFRRQA